ncbi:hypothetical protein NP493_1034g00001 [Ridgeia piscesae]|uniref:Amine oxidase domain-containing protein n=1 Tax=Ridgeia piscesae TaxID=27915 RepID=A0AAD9KHI0_RIDPI|nr:hypothetical protein NP493_1034g00001 [Ridgeia piscesae]
MSVQWVKTVNGRKAEMGANWIHGIDRNPIYKIALKNNLLSETFEGRKLGQKVMFMTETGQPVNTKIIEEVDWAYGTLIAQCEDFYQCGIPTPMENDSVGDFVEREFYQKFADRYSEKELRLRKMILEQRLLGECMITGCDNMQEVALSEVGSFEEIPAVHYVIPPGFEAIMDVLKRDLPNNSILLEHVITEISYGDDGGAPHEVCVKCQNGRKIYADHVIVTISLGYLKKHANHLFSPSLPEAKLASIDSLAMGTVNKVVLEFSGQILPDEVFRLELVWDRDIEDNVDMSQRWFKKINSFEAIASNVLVGWLSGREAEYMETLSDEEVGRMCIEVLKMFLKNNGSSLPQLKHVTTSKWKSNPYTLGSYCFIPIGAKAEDIETLAEPVVSKSSKKPVLLFAGEATHSSFYSSSHGALLTGQQEAQRLIDLYSH